MESAERQPTRRSLRQLFWWFDVVYPIALVAILFGSLTFIIYSGQRQMQLAALAERQLINMSLRLRPAFVLPVDNIQVVTATTKSLGAATPPTETHEGDLHIDVYTRVISKLIAAGTAKLIVSWRPSHHPEQMTYYRALRDLVEVTGAKVTFAVPFTEASRLPDEFGRTVHILADDICNDPIHLQTTCSFNRSWDDWIVQVLVNQTAPKSQHDDFWVSELLASGFPSYILNLPGNQVARHWSFADFMAAPRDQIRKSDWAFVGLGTAYARFGKFPDATLLAVKTPFEPNGIAIHEFWAQIAAMGQEALMPHIPVALVIYLITGVYCVFIIGLMWYFGSAVALGAYCCTLVLAPVSNALALRYLNIYLPVFDLFYFGLMSFIWVAFGTLSYSFYQKWRLRETRRLHIETADLKGNFISLLSHNLNTPIAKMRGMLNILSGMPASEIWRPNVDKATAALAEMEIVVKCVLAATAIEEEAVTITRRNLKTIASDYQDFSKTLLRHLGLVCETRLDMADGSDLVYLPLAFDSRSLNTALLAMAALFFRPGKTGSLQLSFGLVNDGEKDQLHCRLECQSHWLNAATTALLVARGGGSVRQLQGGNFFQSVLTGLLKQVVHTHKGHIKAVPLGQGGQISITMDPDSRAPN